MLGFQQTGAGYVATDEQVARWESRDICPACNAIVEPVGRTDDGRWRYECPCDLGSKWTAYSPADTAGLK
jgi:hypothetical protein